MYRIRCAQDLTGNVTSHARNHESYFAELLPWILSQLPVSHVTVLIVCDNCNFCFNVTYLRKCVDPGHVNWIIIKLNSSHVAQVIWLVFFCAQQTKTFTRNHDHVEQGFVLVGIIKMQMGLSPTYFY